MKGINRYRFLPESNRLMKFSFTAVCSLPPGDRLAEVQKQYAISKFPVQCRVR